MFVCECIRGRGEVYLYICCVLAHLRQEGPLPCVNILYCERVHVGRSEQ